MGVKVNFNNSAPDVYEDATDWNIESVSRDLSTLTILRDNTELAAYSYWSSVVKTPKTELSKQAEEALELVSLVDGGRFTNQDSDWRERAQELLGE